MGYSSQDGECKAAETMCVVGYNLGTFPEIRKEYLIMAVARIAKELEMLNNSSDSLCIVLSFYSWLS